MIVSIIISFNIRTTEWKYALEYLNTEHVCVSMVFKNILKNGFYPFKLPFNIKLSTINEPKYFNHKLRRINKEMAFKNETWPTYRYIYDEALSIIDDRLNDINRSFTNCLDFGGNCYNLLRNPTQTNKIDHMICYANSYEHRKFKELNVKKNSNIELVYGDEDNFDGCFPPDSFDLIVSNLSLHWLNNLKTVMKNLQTCLKPDGVILFTIIGGQTLYQLRSSLYCAEIERLNGFSPHLSPMIEFSDVGRLLLDCNYVIPTIDWQEIVIEYPSIIHLMKDIKGMGDNNCPITSNGLLHKDILYSSQAIYNELYGNNNKLPASYFIINAVAWKNGPNQQIPLKPGSGKLDFKNIGDYVDKI